MLSVSTPLTPNPPTTRGAPCPGPGGRKFRSRDVGCETRSRDLLEFSVVKRTRVPLTLPHPSWTRDRVPSAGHPTDHLRVYRRSHDGSHLPGGGVGPGAHPSSRSRTPQESSHDTCVAADGGRQTWFRRRLITHRERTTLRDPLDCRPVLPPDEKCSLLGPSGLSVRCVWNVPSIEAGSARRRQYGPPSTSFSVGLLRTLLDRSPMLGVDE